MDVIFFIIALVVVGLIVGAIARLLLPGPDPMSLGETILVGIAGSWAAGVVVWLLFDRAGGGLLLSIAFAMLFVWIFRRTRSGGHRAAY